MSTISASHLRTIRSYVKRGGRLTRGQKGSLKCLWSKYGIEFTEQLLDASLFAQKTVVEIGFGMGEALLEYASREPETFFIGIEVHQRGVGHVMANLERRGLTNVKIISHDATLVLKYMIPKESLDRIQLFFPDPWPKGRHQKRRIVQPEFLATSASCLKSEGFIHMATDWDDYYQHMRLVLNESPCFVSAAEQEVLMARAIRPSTRYQQRGERLGHAIHDLVYLKRPLSCV